MDTLLSLRVFATVADLRSFADAAERLGISPAMASKHVQHVETRTGVRLLNRTSRRVSVTEAGALYLAQVRPLLDGLDEIEAQLSQTTLTPRGTLRISLPVWTASPGFARLFADYRALHPEVVLDLDLSGKAVNLVEDGFDLALRVTFSLDEGLIARRLTDVTFPFVAAPGLLDRIGRPASLADLNGAPFLAYTPVAGNGRIRWGEGKEIRFNPVLQSANETMLHLAAREGMGVAIMPNLLVLDDLETGRLERVLPDELAPRAALYAVYADRTYLPAKVRSLLDFLAGPDGIGTVTS